MSMHIAFEAANVLESEAQLGLWAGDFTLDGDVDGNGAPYVLINVADETYEEVKDTIPEMITIFKRNVPVIVKPMSMRMN